MAIVDCEELALNEGYERIWFSRIRVKFQNWEKSGKRMSSNDVQLFSHFVILLLKVIVLPALNQINLVGTQRGITKWHRSHTHLK